MYSGWYCRRIHRHRCPERLRRRINHALSFFTEPLPIKTRSFCHSSTLRRRRHLGCVFPARWQVGDAYPLGALTQTQRDLAQDFVELGLLFKRKAKSTRFYPTSIAVNLIFGSSPSGDAGGAGGGGAQRKPQPAGGLGVRWGRGGREGAGGIRLRACLAVDCWCVLIYGLLALSGGSVLSVGGTSLSRVSRGNTIPTPCRDTSNAREGYFPVFALCVCFPCFFLPRRLCSPSSATFWCLVR